MDNTLPGMVTDVKPLLAKASLPILVTPLGISKEVRPVQPQKAPLPILVTLLGMNVFTQPYNRELVEVSIIALQSSRESYTGFPLSTLIEVKELQPQKA